MARFAPEDLPEQPFGDGVLARGEGGGSLRELTILRGGHLESRPNETWFVTLCSLWQMAFHRYIADSTEVGCAYQDFTGLQPGKILAPKKNGHPKVPVQS
jgi:hypothetical protein